MHYLIIEKMKRINTGLVLLVILFFATSCTKTIDGSSKEAMKSSIESMKESLDDKKKEQFEEAMKLLVFGDGLKGLAGGLEGIQKKLDGKTADEVIAEGEKIKKAKAEKEKAEAKELIDKLYEAKAKAEATKKELAKVKVLKASFHKEDQMGMYEKPIIDLSIENGSQHVIANIVFAAELTSEGRSVPWVKDSFSYDVAGGLEVGEKSNWSLAPNMFSKWGETDAPKDSKLSLEVISIENSKGEAIKVGFDKESQKQLDELLAKYPEFKK